MDYYCHLCVPQPPVPFSCAASKFQGLENSSFLEETGMSHAHEKIRYSDQNWRQ